LNTRGSSGPTVADIGERALIDRIRARCGAASPLLPVGIGDDAAVMVPDRGALQVLTTDALVEGVHFDRRFSPLHDVGFKALAVNLSDVASMGAVPRVALLSLLLPDSLPAADFDAMLDGFVESAADARVVLAGGNISRSPGPLVLDVSLVGSAKPRKILARSGGRPGDAVYVTGFPGSAAAGLGWLRAHAANSAASPENEELAACVARYRRPAARTRIGALLGRMRAASACIDLSDGLADGIRQLARSSGTGAVLEAAALPISAGAREWFKGQGADPIHAALAGGDDYELLFAVRPRSGGRLRAVMRQARGVTLTRIGELTPGDQVVLSRDGQVEPLPIGFAHFQETHLSPPPADRG
jgi:thiamine-monophosphate kinase